MEPLNINNTSYLPKELHKEIHNQAELPTLVKCRQVCQQWKSFVEENAQYKSALTNHNLISSGLKAAPQKLVEEFGGYEKMLELPVLSTGDKGLNYLDYLKNNHMEHSIMRGRDRLHRPFIAFKININDSETAVFNLSSRYTNDDTWMGYFSYGCPQNSDEISHHFGFEHITINHTTCANSIKELMKGDLIEITSEIRVKLA